MKTTKKLLLLFCFLLINAALVFAQASIVTKQAESEEPFVSLTGRFSITTPGQFAGSSGSRGVEFTWSRNGSEIEVGSSDITETISSEKDPKELDSFRDRYFDNRSIKAKVLESKDISLGDYTGREYRIEMPNSVSIMRLYVAEQRLFVLLAKTPLSQRNQEANIIKVFDTFKILSKTFVDAEIEKLVAENTPKPLPQTPVVPKKKSDAADEGLKGRVKSVVTEIAEISFKGQEAPRKKFTIDEYDENGMLTKRILHSNEGLPHDINVFGYLNGSRVSRSGSVELGSPSIITMIVETIPTSSKRKLDTRYDYKYKYRYDLKGNLVEIVMAMSDGKVWLRYIYSYVGNKKTTLVYDERGVLNQKYVTVFDDKSNEIEMWDFRTPLGLRKQVQERYFYSYEFDPQGNWIKRTNMKKHEFEGANFFADSVTYRTITYY